MKRSFKTWIFFIFIFSMIVSSCSLPVSREPYAPGYIERGIASWYGEEFHGRPTSSGEIYDMHALTAAHKLMPLGTVAKVTNLENGRSVTVEINDRLEQKYADVYIVPFDKDDMKFYRVRVGVMKDIKEAEQLAGELSATGLVTFITRKD